MWGLSGHQRCPKGNGAHIMSAIISAHWRRQGSQPSTRLLSFQKSPRLSTIALLSRIQSVAMSNNNRLMNLIATLFRAFCGGSNQQRNQQPSYPQQQQQQQSQQYPQQPQPQFQQYQPQQQYQAPQQYQNQQSWSPSRLASRKASRAASEWAVPLTSPEWAVSLPWVACGWGRGTASPTPPSKCQPHCETPS